MRNNAGNGRYLRNRLPKKYLFSVGLFVFVGFIGLYYKTSAFERGRVVALLFNRSPVDELSEVGNFTNGYCTVYRRRRNPSNTFIRSRLRIPAGEIPIFTYGFQDLISRMIQLRGSWEGEAIAQMDAVLRDDPQLGFLDIGANLGVYTFAAASRGRPVVAVDANIANIRRMRETVLENRMEDRVTLVYNAVGERREPVFMAINPFNVGGSRIHKRKLTATSGTEVDSILMDDLLSVIPFRRAIMKFDIENREYDALQHASKLFDSIDIPMVMMEWSVTHLNNRSKVDYVAGFFRRRGFRPYISPNSTEQLSDDVMKWPWDIVWKK